MECLKVNFFWRWLRLFDEEGSKSKKDNNKNYGRGLNHSRINAIERDGDLIICSHDVNKIGKLLHCWLILKEVCTFIR